MTQKNPRPLRILFLSFRYWPPDFGGELLHCIERLQALAGRGHYVAALTSRPQGASRLENQNGINVIRCPVGGRGIIARGAYLLWTIKTLVFTPFDALHLGVMPTIRRPTGALAAWLYGALARVKRVPTVSVVALADDAEVWYVRGRDGLIKKLYYSNVDRIVTVSPTLFKAVDRWWPGKPILITYGIRDDLFTPAPCEQREAVRERLGIPDDGVVFITIGSAGHRKGSDLLAQAFAKLGPKHRKWFLWLVGPRSRAEGCATDERELAQMFAPLKGCEAQVRFIGRVNDRSELKQLLGASDVFVFPTRREGMPLSPMEAMAVGLPVVVSLIPGVTDVACVDHETGLFITVGDEEALVKAMERLGSDAKLRRALGGKAQQRINEKFSWTGHIHQWEKLYSEGRDV